VRNMLGSRIRVLALSLVSLASLAGTACATNPSTHGLVQETGALRPPERQRRPLSGSLRDFGAMVRAYLADETPILIEIDFITNDGVQKGMPTDLGQYVRQVLDDIGPPFVTTRTGPPVASTVLSPIVPLQRRLPRPRFRIQGTLAYLATVAAKDVQVRADVASTGRSAVDAQNALGRLREVTDMKVGFSLEYPDGVAQPGGSAMYRIVVERRERGTSMSLYIAGSGIGADRKVTVTQNQGDALYDATAAIVMQLLGYALRVPYCRAASAVCARDDVLETLVRGEMRRLSRVELEAQVKQSMWVHGFAVDLSGPGLTAADRRLVASVMKNQSLDFSSFNALAEFAFRSWQTLEYRAGAERVGVRLDEIAHRHRERAVATAQVAANSPPPPKRRPKPSPPKSSVSGASAKAADMSCMARTTGSSTDVSCTVRTPAPSSRETSASNPATRVQPQRRAGEQQGRQTS
jgi:hypothetical protein